MDVCTIREKMGTECHKTSYLNNSTAGYFYLNCLTEDQMQLLKLRSGIKNDINTLCNHHKQLLLHRYEEYERRCCNPFSIHESIRKGDYRIW